MRARMRLGLVVVVAVLTCSSVGSAEADAAARSLVGVAGPTGCVGIDDGCARPAGGGGLTMSAALSPDERHLYMTADGVMAFARDDATGGVTQLPGLSGCYAPDKPGTCGEGRGSGEASAVVVSPDGKHVYVAGDAGVASFVRNATTGALTQIPGPSGCITQTTRGDASVGSTHGQCAKGQGMRRTYAMVIDAAGKHLYVVSRSSHSVAILDRDPITGIVTQAPGKAGCFAEEPEDDTPEDPPDPSSYPCEVGRGLLTVEDVVLSPDGKHLYTVSSNGYALGVFNVDPLTGDLTQPAGDAGCFGRGAYLSLADFSSCSEGSRTFYYPSGVAIAPDGKTLYVTSASREAIEAVRRNPADGTLSAIPGPTGCLSRYPAWFGCGQSRHFDDQWAPFVRPDGLRLYAGIANGIGTFVIDPATGGFEQQGGPAGCTTWTSVDDCARIPDTFTPTTILTTQDGRHLYSVVAFRGLRVFRTPPLDFSPADLHFDIQEVGTTSAPKVVELDNTGADDITVSSLALAGEDAGDFAVTDDDCTGVTLNGGESCPVTIAFTPSSRGRPRAELVATSTGSTSPDAGTLSGIGIVTLPPPPGVQPLPGSDKCISLLGRTTVDDAATAGGCVTGRGLGTYDPAARQGLRKLGPFDITVAGNHVLTTSHRAEAPFWRALTAVVRDPATGALANLPAASSCLHDPVLAGCNAFGRGQAYMVTVSPDGEQAYLGTREGLAIVDRDPAAGALTPRPGTTGCYSRTGFMYPVTSGTPVCTVVADLDASLEIAISPDGTSLYAYSQEGIWVFDRDPATGTLTNKPGLAGCLTVDGDRARTVAGNDGLCTVAPVKTPERIVVSPDGKNVYAMATALDDSGVRDTIAVLDRAPNGTLTPKAGLDRCWADGFRPSASVCRSGEAMESMRGMTITPDGKQVIASSAADRGLAVFDRDPATGVLTMPSGTRNCLTVTGRSSHQHSGTGGRCAVARAVHNVVDLAPTPDGELVLGAGDHGPGAQSAQEGIVLALARDASTGTLTVSGCFNRSTRSSHADPVTTGECAPSAALDRVTSVAVTADGKHAYFGVSANDSAAPAGLAGIAAFRIVKPDEPPPGPALTIDDAAVAEGNAGTKSLVFTLELRDPAIRDATIQYETVNGSAQAGSDYGARSGSVQIEEDDSSATVTVPVNGDTAKEADESFTLRIVSADGAAVADDQASGAIIDDDGAPVPALSVGDAEVVEGDGGSRELSFPLTLSPEQRTVVTASYAVTAGSAGADEDFLVRDGEVLLLPDGNETITVPVVGDTADEADETLTLTLSAPSGATLARAQATGRILDDDEAAAPQPKPDPPPAFTPLAPPPFADPPAPPPPPAPPASPFADPLAGVADLALACTRDLITLIDVVPAGRRVRVSGAAVAELAGRPLEVLLGSKRVGSGSIGADRLFAVTVPGPKARQRKQARYRVRVGDVSSRALKLERRMLVTSASASPSEVTIRGRVIKPLAASQPIVFRRQTSCTAYEQVGRARVGRTGTFTARLPVPAGARAAVYRGETRVPVRRGSKRLSRTFTLPRAVAIPGR